jgi:hypothetical protein
MIVLDNELNRALWSRIPRLVQVLDEHHYLLRMGVRHIGPPDNCWPSNKELTALAIQFAQECILVKLPAHLDKGIGGHHRPHRWSDNGDTLTSFRRQPGLGTRRSARRNPECHE